MTDISGFIDQLRADGHIAFPYFSYFVGAQVALITVTATPTYPTANLAISYTAGAYTDVRRGFLIEVLASDGITPKGWTNVRAGGTLSAGNLPIRELSRADVNIVSGDVLRVRAYVPLADKLPAADSTFAPDQLVYTDEGTAIRPWVASGGHYFGMLFNGESSKQVTLPGTKSRTLDPDSSGAITHLWTVIAGAIAFAMGSSSTDVSPTFDVPVGSHTVLHEVTDSSNGKVWGQYVYLKMDDTSSPSLECNVPGGVTATESDGGMSSVELFEKIDIATLPDGTLGAIYVREWVNGIEQSFGGDVPGREHIVFVGYINQDTTKLTPAGLLTFQMVSPMKRLLSTSAFSKVFDAAGSAWSLIANMTVLLAIQHFRYYVWLTENFDVNFVDDALDVLYPKLYEQLATPADQIRDLVKSRQSRLVCLLRGSFEIQSVLQLLTSDQRDDVLTNHFGQDDYLGGDGNESNAPEVVRTHFKNTKIYKLTGISAGLSGNQSAYSDAPGESTGRGSGTTTYDKAIFPATDQQNAANIISGLLWADSDGVYIDPTSGEQLRAGAWKFTFPGSYRGIFDFDQSFMQFDDAVDNLRGIDVTRLRKYITRINIAFESGTALVQLNAQDETLAPAGEKGQPPPSTPLPSYTPISLTPVPPIPSTDYNPVPFYGGVDMEPTRLIVFDSGGAHCHVALSWTPITSTLSYSDVSTGLTGTNIWATADPWNYRRYYALQTTGLYRNDDPFGGGSWSLVADYTTMFGTGTANPTRILMSINRRGWIALSCGLNMVVTSPDYGASWNRYRIAGSSNNFTLSYFGLTSHLALYCYSDLSNGVLFATNRGAIDLDQRLFKSVDWGETWTAINDFDLNSGSYGTYDISIPFERNPGVPNLDDGGLWIYFSGQATNDSAVGISTNGGTTIGTTDRRNHGGLQHDMYYAPQFGTSLNTFTRDGRLLNMATNRNFSMSSSQGAASIFTGGASDYSGADGTDFINGYPVHSQALLHWSSAQVTFHWTVDAGANIHSAVAPSGYTGVSYLEWNIALINPPVA